MPRVVGIQAKFLDNIEARQRNSMWCWAACIEMIFRGYGFPNVAQEDIVYRTFGISENGCMPNSPGSRKHILWNLNVRTQKGNQWFAVRAAFRRGCPPARRLLQELQGNRPLILHRGLGRQIGHTVLVTAAEIDVIDGRNKITKLVIRDPAPGFSGGRKVYWGRPFAETVLGYFLVHVRKETAISQMLSELGLS